MTAYCKVIHAYGRTVYNSRQYASPSRYLSPVMTVDKLNAKVVRSMKENLENSVLPTRLQLLVNFYPYYSAPSIKQVLRE